MAIKNYARDFKSQLGNLKKILFAGVLLLVASCEHGSSPEQTQTGTPVSDDTVVPDLVERIDRQPVISPPVEPGILTQPGIMLPPDLLGEMLPEILPDRFGDIQNPHRELLDEILREPTLEERLAARGICIVTDASLMARFPRFIDQIPAFVDCVALSLLIEHYETAPRFLVVTDETISTSTGRDVTTARIAMLIDETRAIELGAFRSFEPFLFPASVDTTADRRFAVFTGLSTNDGLARVRNMKHGTPELSREFRGFAHDVIDHCALGGLEEYAEQYEAWNEFGRQWDEPTVEFVEMGPFALDLNDLGDSRIELYNLSSFTYTVSNFHFLDDIDDETGLPTRSHVRPIFGVIVRVIYKRMGENAEGFPQWEVESCQPHNGTIIIGGSGPGVPVVRPVTVEQAMEMVDPIAKRKLIQPPEIAENYDDIRVSGAYPVVDPQ